MATCEQNGHIYSHDDACVFCGEVKPPERWEPIPVPLGDGRHDIGDDARAAIFHRLHDDFTLAAPWLTAEQRKHLAMLAAASVRALLHELGTLRDLSSDEAQSGQAASAAVGKSNPADQQPSAAGDSPQALREAIAERLGLIVRCSNEPPCGMCQRGRDSILRDVDALIDLRASPSGDRAAVSLSQICEACGHLWRFHTMGGMCQGTAKGIECHCCLIPDPADAAVSLSRTAEGPVGSFGYCAVCYHPLDVCSHCELPAKGSSSPSQGEEKT